MLRVSCKAIVEERREEENDISKPPQRVFSPSSEKIETFKKKEGETQKQQQSTSVQLEKMLSFLRSL
jgi:hypothetical protein